MKKLFNLLFFLLLAITQVNAQYGTYSTEDIKKLKTTKTYIVLDNGSTAYNKLIKEAVTKYWKVTKYEFIDLKTFDKLQHDLDKSFLVKVERTTENIYTTVYLSIILGYKENKAANVIFNLSTISNLKFATYITAFLIDPTKFEDSTKIVKNLDIYIKGMHKYIEQVEAKKFNSIPKATDYFNSHNEVIRSKELYVLKEDLIEEVNTPEKIKEIYPKKVKIVTQEEINKIITEANENAVFVDVVVSVGGNKKYVYKTIYSAKDGEVLYTAFYPALSNKKLGLMESDFKKLSK